MTYHTKNLKLLKKSTGTFPNNLQEGLQHFMYLHMVLHRIGTKTLNNEMVNVCLKAT